MQKDFIQRLIKQMEKNARYTEKSANDSHTKAEAKGYRDAVEDLKKLTLKDNNL